MHIKPEAVDREGFIIDQRQTDNITFGQLSSERNGCGWIACYNLLKSLEREPDPEELVLRLEKTLAAGGRLGLNFFALARELHRQRLPMNFACTSFGATELAERCRAGIVLYFTGRRNHFVAFRREEDGRLRFYGAVPGREDHISSMGEFYWQHVKVMPALTITVE